MIKISRYLTVLVVPFIIALTACSSLANAAGSQSTIPTQPVLEATDTPGNESVTVKDQEFDGTTVVVADVVSDGPGWMVIHSQVDGSVGPAIGEAHLNNGDNKNVAVSIDPAQATPVMYAMLHTDAGVIGKYEYPGPDVPAMLNGQMISPSFNVTMYSDMSNLTPDVKVMDQDISNGKVTIASVSSRGPGWIAIHTQDADGNPGPEIGYTAVKPGVNQNVVVNIDVSKATPVLFAMLHSDAGTIGKYEFPGPDAPQLANGQMVAPSFMTGTAASATTTPMVMSDMGSSPTPETVQSSPGGTPTPDMGMVMITPSGSMSPVVKVSDQPLVNGTVMVAEVVSDGPGWIVIYTTNVNGQPDQPIGHAPVSDGDNLMVPVTVDPTMAQGTLYAQLHIDSGTVGKFEFPGPDAPVMIGVQMISHTFKIVAAQATSAPATPVILQPSITISNQAVESATVTVDQVVSNGDWWLVINRQNPDGSMGDAVGETLIKNGVNKNVVVKINLLQATPVLFAMLYEDHGTIGKFEYPGPDAPVMVNGHYVAPKFYVTGLIQDVTINIQKISNTVSYLTDGNGMSLYISLKDGPSKSNCDATCLVTWRPVLVSGKIIAGPGVNLANLGISTRQDGTRQVTYLGAPLYTYSKDVKPGDTNGHGIDGVWFLVAP
jgi:predicted lipoprotein with Yx(FWY)xxD motif